MKVYSTHDEENLRDAAFVREWAASGFLDPSQSSALQAELRTDLRQTNVFLRAILFAFASVIAVAVVALFADFLRPTHSTEWSTLFLISGVVCWVLAEIACQSRVYRYGLEEALALLSIIFISLGVGGMMSGSPSSQMIAGLLTASVGFLALYLRFGFVYAAVAGMAAAAAIPFQWSNDIETKRLLSALIFACVVAVIRLRRHEQPDEPAGSGRSIIEGAAWLGVYLLLNLQLTMPSIFYSPVFDAARASESRTWFYMATWAAIWVLPATCLWLGLGSKERTQIDVGAVMTLLTLSTNKRYLGWTMHTWDPILLGVLLMGVAILVRRWLQSGPDGQRNGYTALRLLRSDERKLAAISIASAALQPHAAGNPGHAQQPEFREGGGKSGGGGATGNF